MHYNPPRFLDMSNSPVSPIRVRPAELRDADAACIVLRRSIQELCERDHQNDPVLLDNWLGNKVPEIVGPWFTAPANYAVVAEREGAVVGVALMTHAGKVSLCYVLPEALHTGAGKAMLDDLEAKARELGITILRMHGTASGRDFFVRHGYIVAGREKACFGLDCDFLWKKLDSTYVSEQPYCACKTS